MGAGRKAGEHSVELFEQARQIRGTAWAGVVTHRFEYALMEFAAARNSMIA